MTITILIWCVAVLLGLALFAIVLNRSQYASRIVYGASFVISLIALGSALFSLVADTGTIPTVTLPLGLPWLGAHFRLDSLSAFFLVVVNLGTAVASLFAIGYGRHEDAPHRVLPFYPAFLAGMNLVVLADDAFSFLISWEFMSLTSWALVMTNHRERDNTYAAYVYLVMASFGTIALLLAFGLLAGPDGNYGFATIRDSGLSPGLASLTLVLAIVGAGSKAGIVPLHVWLPLAHPAAPSHVSALMSGVMTKVAVYGFIRIAFDLVGMPQWWWSMVVLATGRGHHGDGRALCVDAARSQAPARLSHGGKHRHHLHRAGARARVQGVRPEMGGGARAHRRCCCMCSTTRCSRACCFLVPAPCSR